MKKCHPILLVVFIAAAVIVVAAPSLSAEPLKINGFYIGMSIDDALKNFEALGFEGLSIKESKSKSTQKTVYTIYSRSGPQFKVISGSNVRSVSSIILSGGIVDRIFHTRGIGVELFQKMFADAYDILKMQVFKENPGTDPIKGWEHYNLKEGYRIRVFLSKDIEMIKTDKAADFAFD